MKIGYTINKQHQKVLLKDCDYVYVETQHKNSGSFQTFVETYIEHEIYVTDIVDIGLQVAQLLPSIELLQNNGKYLHFLSQTVKPQSMTNQAYTRLLSEIGKQEKAIMAERTKRGLAKAKEKGRKMGRPEIDNQTITGIQTMYVTEQKSIREIAENFDVAIGTVSKYALAKTSKQGH